MKPISETQSFECVLKKCCKKYKKAKKKHCKSCPKLQGK